MPPVKAISGKELIRYLLRDGWVVERDAQHGLFLRKGHRTTVIRNTSESLRPGTLSAIIGDDQTGLGREGLEDLIRRRGRPRKPGDEGTSPAEESPGPGDDESGSLAKALPQEGASSGESDTRPGGKPDNAAKPGRIDPPKVRTVKPRGTAQPKARRKARKPVWDSPFSRRRRKRK